jgi:hypothetical protein
MGAAKGIFPVETTNIAGFGYPVNCHVTVKQNDEIQIHEIFYSAAPAALFDNAPNGSILWDVVAGNVYQKRGALGASNGTWKYQAINT